MSTLTPAASIKALPDLTHERLGDGRTRITYTLPADSTDVFLGLWSQHAFYIRTLVEKPQGKAGQYSVVWDGLDQNGNPAGPGVYISRMSVGNSQGASGMFVAAI